MKKFLAVVMASVVIVGAACAQDTGGDKQKVSKSKTVNADEKSNVKTAAGKSAVTKGPKAQPFPTRKPADKTELNPQPLPPGAKVKSSSQADKVALNPQPLPPGEKAAHKPVHALTKVQKQTKITVDSGKKASTGIEKGSTKQE